MHCSPRLLGQCGWVIGRILFYVQWTKRRSNFIETQKKKKEKGRRLKSPILTEQVWTTTWPKNRFNKNQEWLVSFKKATCVYSTVNPCESFMFSLYWLSSAAFCDSPDRRHCPKVASFVRPLHAIIFLCGIEADSTERASWPTLPAQVANQNIAFTSFCPRMLPAI